LSPNFFNKLKEFDTKRNFMDLALYDKDLSKYDFNALVDAYNSAVGINPHASDNATVLRNIMLHNLATGGIKDPFGLDTELSIAKKMEERDKATLEKEKLQGDISLNREKAKEFGTEARPTKTRAERKAEKNTGKASIADKAFSTLKYIKEQQDKEKAGITDTRKQANRDLISLRDNLVKSWKDQLTKNKKNDGSFPTTQIHAYATELAKELLAPTGEPDFSPHAESGRKYLVNRGVMV
jgi:hypothetical protein